jgi:predicted dehydrogenase
MGKKNEVRLMTLDPGHFHAALVQKSMYKQVHPMVHVFAPEGDDVTQHLAKIEAFNSRKENPTAWKPVVYTGTDYLEKMLLDKPGNVMITAGNNQKKTEYILQTVEAGINVLADKPMVITPDEFPLLMQAFKTAEENGVLLYDIMTERYEITTLLQKEFSQIQEVFGQLQMGSLEQPAVTKESVHHLFKHVSGKPLKRPPWFFDVEQEGEGIVDVTTHLVDLVQWECFPEQIIDYQKDINMLSAKRWNTKLTPEQFKKVTHLESYPDYLKKYLNGDTLLVSCNGEMNYTLNGVHAKVSVIWNFEAPEGTGDTHYSIMRGTKSDLIIKQGPEEHFKPTLYVKGKTDTADFDNQLQQAIDNTIGVKYPGVKADKLADNWWRIHIPEKYKIGHEGHFSQVTQKYLNFLVDGKLPDWEVPNMIAKYYTTTKALEVALMND